jgi:hypothetical protein
MDEAPHIGPDMRDLMATVGELLLLWGFLENAIRERVLPIEPSDPRNSKTPLLMRWREAEKATRSDDSKLAKLFADIDEVAVIRNCIAHGLMSASANPWSSEEPEVVCFTPSSDRRITMSEMNNVKQRLYSLTNRVRDL